jgi:glycosyltransferase involved in cell wall biosynthesis
VATDLPAIRDVLRHGENALLVPPGDPRALAGAVREVLSNPELAERLAAVAFREAGGYSWETRAERIERLLREVLAPLEGSQSSRGVGKHPLKISHS